MKFNINDNVRVKLTQHGRDIIANNHRALFADYTVVPPYPEVEEDADGWSSWQLWILMQEFGDSMGGFADLPFETEIEIVESKS